MLGALVTIVLATVAFAVLLPRLSRDGDRERSAEKGALNLDEYLQVVRKQMAQGNFAVAWELIDSVAARRERFGSLSPAESRALAQAHREADLFAHPLTLPLEEVVRQARLVRDPRERILQFRPHRDRAVIFDGLVRRDDQGRPTLADHVVEVGDEVARLALEDVELLRELPLDDEPRLIFGCRLQACEREEGGGWAIRFVPDGGVLLTDFAALAAFYPVVPDEAARGVLARQRKWLDGRGALSPNRR